MFKAELKDKLARIFELKVSFNLPSESQEQDCLFVQILESKNRVTDGKMTGQVKGKIRVFVNSDKLPYGYFAQKMMMASISDANGFFFHDLEENNGTVLNICERTLSFVYLFASEYNPNIGEVTSLETIATIGNVQ